MSTDFSNRRRFSSSNIGTLVIAIGLKHRSNATFLLMCAAALRTFSLEAESWLHEQRRNVTSLLYCVMRQHGSEDLLLRQCACIGSNMLHKAYSQSFNDLVMRFDLSPGCSFATHCCRRLFGLQLRAGRICDPGHTRHPQEIQRLLLWTALCHFLGNSCNSNSPEGMHVGGVLKSAGFVFWLQSTLCGFTAIIPVELDHEINATKSDAAPQASSGSKQSQSGLLFTHVANTQENYVGRMTEDGSEELSLSKTIRMPVFSVARGNGMKFARRQSMGMRTDTFDSWNQHGLRMVALPANLATADVVGGSAAAPSSLLTRAVPAAASVVEAAISQLMRLISNFCELLPSIIVTAPYDTELVEVQGSAATPPSVNGAGLLCDDALLPKLLDFFQAVIQYRSAALHAASILLKMQGQSNLDPDISARIQELLLKICRRYFPKIMRSELGDFVCLAPRTLPSIASAAELHQLVGVAYEKIDIAIQQMFGENSSSGE